MGFRLSQWGIIFIGTGLVVASLVQLDIFIDYFQLRPAPVAPQILEWYLGNIGNANPWIDPVIEAIPVAGPDVYTRILDFYISRNDEDVVWGIQTWGYPLSWLQLITDDFYEISNISMEDHFNECVTACNEMLAARGKPPLNITDTPVSSGL